MKTSALFVLAILLLAPLATVAANELTTLGPHATFGDVEIGAVKWMKGFWADKFELCHRAMLPSVEAALLDERKSEHLANFKIAAGLEHGQYRGTDWSDGNCYKWIEAMAYLYAVIKDAALDRKMDEWIGIIARAQAPDWGDMLYRKLTPRQLPPPTSGLRDITLISYFVRANRGPSLMEVWLPLAK